MVSKPALLTGQPAFVKPKNPPGVRQQHERVFDLRVEEHLVERVRDLLPDRAPVINVERAAAAALRLQGLPTGRTLRKRRVSASSVNTLGVL